MDEKRGLYVIPFLETFFKCFEDKVENKNDCIRELMTNDKVPPSVIKYTYDNYSNFFDVINEALDSSFTTLEEVLANTKTMFVNENLKLRSGEATSTQVLSVMSAGTKVKILELGKAETIDGISSNWVKVEVQKGAKDRDGNPIKAGTVGWCYGGYLK